MMLRRFLLACAVAFCAACFYAPPAVAQSQPSAGPAVPSAGLLDRVYGQFKTATEKWGTKIQGYAEWLFWVLAVIALVWTGGLMALRRAEVGEVLAEYFKFAVFIGFHYWLLTNGPKFAGDIVRSFIEIGNQASGVGSVNSPSAILDLGFNLFFRALDDTSITAPVDSFFLVAISLGCLLVLALIAVNVLVLLCTAWALAYAGVYFLGFGGSRWTSDMAIQYFKTVLSIAVQLMTAILLVGVAKEILTSTFDGMSKGLSLKEMGMTLVTVVVLHRLVASIPPMVGAMSGASLGSVSLGGGAAGAAVAGAAIGGAAVASAGMQLVGGGSALNAAIGAARAAASDSGTSGGLSGGLSVAAGAVGRLASAAASVAGEGAKSNFDKFMGKSSPYPEPKKKGVSGTFGGRMADQIRSTTQGSKEAGAEGAGSNQDGAAGMQFGSNGFSAGSPSTTAGSAMGRAASGIAQAGFNSPAGSAHAAHASSAATASSSAPAGDGSVSGTSVDDVHPEVRAFADRA